MRKTAKSVCFGSCSRTGESAFYHSTFFAAKSTVILKGTLSLDLRVREQLSNPELERAYYLQAEVLDFAGNHLHGFDTVFLRFLSKIGQPD